MSREDVTQVLSAIERGDRQAAGQLLPLVYQALRRLAEQKLAAEAPGHTLQATALVHEAFLRLRGAGANDKQHWEGRRHFFGASAEAMRRILVDNARRKKAEKRGGGRGRQDLDAVDVAAPERSDDLVALDEALTRLAAADAPAAELVNLRYFAGLSLPAAAEVLDISPRTADRVWAYAKAWLHREIAGAGRD